MISIKYKKLIKSFGAYSISNALSQFLMIVYSFLLANHLGPALFGVYAGHLSFVLLLSFIINWGFDTYFLFHSGTFKNDQNVNEFAGKILLTKLLLGVVWISVLVFISQFINSSFFKIDLLIIASIDTLADSLFLTQLTALNIKNKTKELSLLLFLSRTAKLLGGIAIILIGISSINRILSVRLATTLVFSLLAISIAKTSFSSFKFQTLKKLWRSSLTYGLSETLALVYAQVDISLLAILLGEVQTGLYTTSSRLIIALFSIPNAGYLLVIPKLRELFLINKRNMVNYFLKIQLGFLILGIVLFIGMFISGKWLISFILIDEYSISGDLLQILSVVLLFKSLNFGFGALLVALGWQKIRLIPQLVTSVMAVMLNLFFIPKFGLFGAAYVYILSEAILLCGYAFLAFRWFKRNRLSL